MHYSAKCSFWGKRRTQVSLQSLIRRNIRSKDNHTLEGEQNLTDAPLGLLAQKKT